MTYWGEAAANWMTAVGTIVAAGVAAGVVVRDSQERKQRRVEARESQARRVNFVTRGTGGSSVDRHRMRVTYRVTVSNHSDLAVHQVTLLARARCDVPPDASAADLTYETTSPMGSILPGDQPPVEVMFVLPRQGNDLTPHVASFEVSFTDDSGNKWIRKPDHRLVAAPNDP